MSIRTFAGLALAGLLSVSGAAPAAAPPPESKQVAFEVRIVTVSAAGLKRLGVGQDGAPRMALLDDAGVYRLLEGVQKDRAANVMQAPLLKAHIGQAAQVAIGESRTFVTGVAWTRVGEVEVPGPRREVEETGLRLCLKAEACGGWGGLCVEAELEYSFLNPEVPDAFPVCWIIDPAPGSKPGKEPVVLTQYIEQPKRHTVRIQTSLEIPAGQTAVVALGEFDRVIKRDVNLSVLGYLPGAVGDLLRVPARVKQREGMFVLITPRLVAAE